MARTMDDLAVGETLYGYRVSRREPLPHLNGTYYELVHQRLGSRHLHVAVEDDNNAFNMVFPTIPQDSTGVAHILEHLVLCGSERFPVRDPFFSMLPRSLYTFMNAMTSSAWTTYPFSTRNAQDFYNLLDVYLDACFFPLLGEQSFKQEAHRFEFQELSDPSTPLEYKGVVFNEMKGAMSSVPSVMYRSLGKAVFPALTYANNSGGDPQEIPDLTWAGLRAFHATHYHPSNAWFYSYGNLPLAETLRRIEETVLARFERLDVRLTIPDQPRFDSPRVYETTYPLAKSEDNGRKSQVLVCWLTAPITDSFEMLSLGVLEEVLLGNVASPLRLALIESGLGSALADATGLEDDPREAVFAAGLKDVAPADAEAVEALILATLGGLVAQGVDTAMVDAAVHRLEIATREVSNAGWPYGLKVFFRLYGPYLYGGDPYRALLFDDDLARLAEARAVGGYFEGLIQRYLLDNPHRVRIELHPDPAMTERLDRAEAQKLAAIKARLTPDEVSAIVAEAEALQALQEADQDTSVLPTLTLDDIPQTMEDVPHSLETVAGTTVGLFPQPTNGLSYVDLQFDFSALPDELLDLLPVFAYVLPKMGAGASDYLDMARRINAHTGGISAGPALRNDPEDHQRFRSRFTLSGKALIRNHEPFLAILRDFVTGLHFDRHHLRNLLGQHRAGLESSVVSSGHMYALRQALAQLSGAGMVQERLGGLSQLATARRLAALDEAGLEPVVADLERIRDHLFRTGSVAVCITSEADELAALRDAVAEILARLPLAVAATNGRLAVAATRQAVARTTAVPVAYDVAAWPTVSYTHPDAPALHVLSHYLRNTYLHRELREKGGAYGGFASASTEGGHFAMMSYRDPHIVRTFQVYRDAVRVMREEPIKAEDAREAILRASADVDPLLSPDNKGRARFFADLAGYTLPRREDYKAGLLAVTIADMRRVAGAYLSGEAALAVVGGEEKVAAANAEMGGQFQVAPV